MFVFVFVCVCVCACVCRRTLVSASFFRPSLTVVQLCLFCVLSNVVVDVAVVAV